MIIVTNNPMVIENVCKKYIFLENKSYVEVLIKCRDLIYDNYEILSHPLYGSVKPNETPYRSIIMKKVDKLDVNSVILIEDAISTAKKFQNNMSTPVWNESILNDFKVIDFDIFDNTIKRIQFI